MHQFLWFDGFYRCRAPPYLNSKSTKTIHKCDSRTMVVSSKPTFTPI